MQILFHFILVKVDIILMDCAVYINMGINYTVSITQNQKTIFQKVNTAAERMEFFMERLRFQCYKSKVNRFCQLVLYLCNFDC